MKRDGADMSQWRWGSEHVALLQHKVYSHIPLLDRVSDLSMPSSGGFYTLDRGGGFDTPADQPFARTHGGGYRGHLRSRRSRQIALHDRDRRVRPHLLAALRRPGAAMERGKSITLAGDEEALKRAGAQELTFTPK